MWHGLDHGVLCAHFPAVSECRSRAQSADLQPSRLLHVRTLFCDLCAQQLEQSICCFDGVILKHVALACPACCIRCTTRPAHGLHAKPNAMLHLTCMADCWPHSLLWQVGADNSVSAQLSFAANHFLRWPVSQEEAILSKLFDNFQLWDRRDIRCLCHSGSGAVCPIKAAKFSETLGESCSAVWQNIPQNQPICSGSSVLVSSAHLSSTVSCCHHVLLSICLCVLQLGVF